jgi:hypothetical protein
VCLKRWSSVWGACRFLRSSCQIQSTGVQGNCSAKSHGGEDDSTGLRAEHSLDHTAHAVRTASGALAVPLQRKQSVQTGSRQAPRFG